MSAIPGQTIASYEHSLREILALEPQHISSYSLIIEEGTPFFEKYSGNPPVDEDTDRIMYEMTQQMLADRGYARYEISIMQDRDLRAVTIPNIGPGKITLVWDLVRARKSERSA